MVIFKILIVYSKFKYFFIFLSIAVQIETRMKCMNEYNRSCVQTIQKANVMLCGIECNRAAIAVER